MKHSDFKSGDKVVIVKASEYPIGTRLFGKRLMPNIEAIKGKKPVNLNNIKKFDPLGVYEVTFHPHVMKQQLEGETRQVQFQGHKRWLNITQIVDKLADSKPCELVLKHKAGYLPAQCVVAKDWIGRSIDDTGNLTNEIYVPIKDSRSLLPNGKVYLPDTMTFATGDVLLDSGAQRNELSSRLAKQLGLYDTNESITRSSAPVIYGNGISHPHRAVTIDLEIPLTANNIVYPAPPIRRTLEFTYPETPIEGLPFEILLGREGLQACNITIVFKKQSDIFGVWTQ